MSKARTTTAPLRPVYTEADDRKLAAAVFKCWPAADTFRALSKQLDEELREQLPGESPVMMIGRAAELGYLVAHALHLNAGYFRPAYSYLSARALRPPEQPADPRVRNGEQIMSAAGRLPKILAKLAEAGREPPDPLRVAVPEGSGNNAEQVVVFTRNDTGKFVFQCLEK